MIVVLLLVLYLALLSNAAWWHFVNSDDAEGYLVMPLRILQTGSTGLDPFLFRRVEAGLAATTTCMRLPLSIFDFPAAHSVDFGLGSLLIALLAGSHANAVAPGNTEVLAASLTLALVVVVFAPVINLAPDVPAIALIYAAIRQARRLSREPAIRLGDHVLFGLLIFSLVCLRTSYLVPAFAVAASLYLAMLWTRRHARVVLAALAAFVVVAVFAVPWMVVVQRIAGTPLYPLLGFGTMTHTEVAAFTAPSILAKNVGRILFCYPLAVLGLWAVTRARPAPQSETFLCILTPLLLLLSVIAQTKYTIFGWRYGYVAVVPLPLFLFVELLGAPAARRFFRTLLPACLALFAIALVHNEFVASGHGRVRPTVCLGGGTAVQPLCADRRDRGAGEAARHLAGDAERGSPWPAASRAARRSVLARLPPQPDLGDGSPRPVRAAARSAAIRDGRRLGAVSSCRRRRIRRLRLWHRGRRARATRRGIHEG